MNESPLQSDEFYVGEIVTKYNREQIQIVLKDLLGEAAQDTDLSRVAREIAAARVEQLTQGENCFLAESLPAISYGLTFVLGATSVAFLKGMGREAGKIAAQELWAWLKRALEAKPGQVEKLVDADENEQSKSETTDGGEPSR